MRLNTGHRMCLMVLVSSSMGDHSHGESHCQRSCTDNHCDDDSQGSISCHHPPILAIFVDSYYYQCEATAEVLNIACSILGGCCWLTHGRYFFRQLRSDTGSTVTSSVSRCGVPCSDSSLTPVLSGHTTLEWESHIDHPRHSWTQTTTLSLMIKTLVN